MLFHHGDNESRKRLLHVSDGNMCEAALRRAIPKGAARNHFYTVERETAERARKEGVTG